MPIIYVKAWLNTFFSIFFPPEGWQLLPPHRGNDMGGDSVMKIDNDSDKYLDFYEDSWTFLFNWIIPALIFIALIAIALHSYFITIGEADKLCL